MANVPSLRELPSILLAVLFIAMTIIASLWILRPFLLALIWATLVVVSTWQMMRSVEQRLWGKRGLAVIVMTTTLLLVVIVPLALAMLTIINHAEDIAGNVNAFAHARMPAPPGWVEQVPLFGPKFAAEWQSIAVLGPDELHARAAPYATAAARWILSKAGGFGAFFLHLLLTVIISALLYHNGEAAVGGLRAFARRLAGTHGELSITLGAQAIRAIALGVVVTAVVTALLGGIGLAAARVPLAGFLTALMFVLAVAQIGAVPVLMLAVVWLYWTGHTGTAAALLVWTLVVSSVGSVLNPLLIKRHADLPLVLIFAGVVGGLLAFGVVGLFVGPTVLAVAYAHLSAWVREDAEGRTASTAQGTVT